jgi:glycosyltransferase involved in cell wall biosynthesis
MNRISREERVLILIPVYNEAGTIANLVSEIRTHHPDLDLVVVDDGSRDGSGDLASAAGARLLRHAFNLGDGAARQTGFLYALRNGYEYVIHLDGDRQHSPQEIYRLLSALKQEKVDLVVGSRFRGKCAYRLPLFRRIGMKLFSTICSLVARQKITDPTSGFRGLNRKAMRLYVTGYYPQHFPDADVIISSHFRGLRIRETPITVSASHSQSLHRGGTIIYYIYKMLLSTFVSMLKFNEDNTREKKE